MNHDSFDFWLIAPSRRAASKRIGTVSRRLWVFALAVVSPLVGIPASAIAAQPKSPALVQRGDALDSSVGTVTIERITARARALPRLHSLIVAHRGRVLIEQAFRGPGLDVPVNVKSVSKTLIATLAGIAIERGILSGVTQPVSGLLASDVPRSADPLFARLTLGHLLSMQAGLERTSGVNYGRWVRSANWVRFVLARPFVDEPGGRMLYSTGNTHLVSAILTKASGRSTHALARDWLSVPLGIGLPPWPRDPQGIYFGGNNMRLSPRALLRFGEMYRNGGVFRGRRVVSSSWIRDAWTPRTVSHYSGDGYGYGWFIASYCDRSVYYARGFGGQFLYVAPSLSLTVVITSNQTVRTRVDGYYDSLRALVFDDILPAVFRAGGGVRNPPGEGTGNRTQQNSCVS